MQRFARTHDRLSKTAGPEPPELLMDVHYKVDALQNLDWPLEIAFPSTVR